jgi:2-keto-3-deoxy-L-rhamnonate aldolase RhmA
MQIAANHLKQKMTSNQVALGFGVNQMRSTAVGLIAAAAGYDCLFIDLEHSVLSDDTVSQIAIAALGQGVTPLVRCSKEAVHQGVRLLDNGVMGLVVPHVEDADEARQIVAACRYPPRGHRSLTSSLPHLRYEQGDWKSLAPQLDDAQLVFLMAESRRGVDNIESILAVEGFDGVLLGASDLAADMGFIGSPTHPQVVEACLKVAHACAAAGKLFAVGGVRDDQVVAALIKAGARLVLGGSDVAFMRAGSRAAAEKIRAIAANCA